MCLRSLATQRLTYEWCSTPSSNRQRGCVRQILALSGAVRAIHIRSLPPLASPRNSASILRAIQQNQIADPLSAVRSSKVVQSTFRMFWPILNLIVHSCKELAVSERSLPCHLCVRASLLARSD